MPNSVYYAQNTVRTYECDGNKQLKPECILHWFQEVAQAHAEQLGFGYQFVMANHLAWVESRLDVVIHRMPEWNEPVTVKTWTAPESALLARRNMEIYSQMGTPLVSATALWAMIDIERRRPVPLKKYITQWPNTPCENNIPTPHVELGDSEPETHFWTAQRRDMDFNKHINNSAYLIWALETLPEEWLNTHTLNTLHLRFKKESRAGELLHAKSYITANTTVHHIRRDEDTLCEVTLQWRAV